MRGASRPAAVGLAILAALSLRFRTREARAADRQSGAKQVRAIMGRPRAYANDVTAYPVRLKPLLGQQKLDDREVSEWPVMNISLGGLHSSLSFFQTNRGLATIAKFFPHSMLDVAALHTERSVILDVATGGGQFVRDLRRKGVFAYGLDPILTASQKRQLLLDATKQERGANNRQMRLRTHNGQTVRKAPFLQAHAANTGLAGGQVDAIYETYGVFHYLFSIDLPDYQAYLSSAVGEWLRILAPGGKIRIANHTITASDKTYEKFFKTFPAVRRIRTEAAEYDDETQTQLYALEVEKTLTR